MTNTDKKYTNKNCIDITCIVWKVRGIIENNISAERSIKDWNEYKNNILNNLSKINFNTEIENYITFGKTLHVTKKEMKELLYNYIVLNRNIFEETNTYKVYRFKEEIDIKQRDLNEFIDVCINILVKKQQLILKRDYKI
jgi:hypothetical protein